MHCKMGKYSWMSSIILGVGSSISKVIFSSDIIGFQGINEQSVAKVPVKVVEARESNSIYIMSKKRQMVSIKSVEDRWY